MIPMSSQLVGSSVVIVAQQFNPTVVSQPWLMRHGLATEEDFNQGYIFSDSLVQFQAKDFHFLLVQEQLQFTPRPAPDREQEIVRKWVGTIAEKLPHTPYRAIGLNFMWQVTPDTESVRDWTRRTFYRADVPLFEVFGSSDSMFGGYFSRDVLDCRLRLDVKPVTATAGEKKLERVFFNFNYHLELAILDRPVEAIHEMLERWDEAKKESVKVVQSAERGPRNA
jgi:hypothetical protein